MKLDADTKIDDLLKEYPFLLKFLPTLRPEYRKLRNPLIRKTMGRVATLKRVAAMGSMELGELISAIEGEIARQSGADSEEPEDLSERKEVMKSILRDLHAGEEAEELKVRFSDLISDISPSELASVEQSLIEEGLPESEVKNLCSLHVEVFKEGLDKGERPQVPGGHPVHTLMMENRAAENFITEMDELLCDIGEPGPDGISSSHKFALLGQVDALAKIDKHYLKKENQLFPLLEDHGITGPSQVMWAIHDDIRASIKASHEHLEEDRFPEAITSLNELSQAVRDLVYKEEHILFPMSLETLSEAEWVRVRRGEEEVGYAWVEPATGWEPQVDAEAAVPAPGEPMAAPLELDTGRLTLEQINLMLTHLPVDMTFVDADDRVAYFSQGKERIFPRSPGIIGRAVQNCHPPKSVDVVNRIVEAFKSGERDVAEFWIELGGRFIHIRYFAIRGAEGTYKGTLEVSQDLTDLRQLEGERHLLDWE
jgi:DUF438 domain-containing protein